MRKKTDFDRAYSQGRRIPSSSFTVIVCPSGQRHPRLGVTIPKSVGGAVVRNRVRRRLREAFRRNREIIRAPMDIVLHVRPAAAGARYEKLESELLAAVRRMGQGSGKRQ